MTDTNFNGAINIKSNVLAPLPGTIRYNATDDVFQGYTASTNPYNNSKWATMSLSVASPTKLGGFKVGNNLGITADGILNASAVSLSQKFQRILIISQPVNTGDYSSITQCLAQYFGYDFSQPTQALGWSNSTGELQGLDRAKYPFPGYDSTTGITSKYIVLLTPGTYTETASGLRLPPYVSLVGQGRDECILNIAGTTSGYMVRLSEGCEIRSLTIDMANINGVNGVYGTGLATDIILDDIILKSSAVSCTAQTAINFTACPNLTFRNIYADINLAAPTLANNSVTLINLANGSQCSMYNCGLSVSSIGTSLIKLINITGQSTAIISYSQLLISQTQTDPDTTVNNTCINALDSNLWLDYCKIKCTGYDSNDTAAPVTQKSRGITFASPVPAAPITYTPSGTYPLNFMHFESHAEYDEISAPLSQINFKTAGIYPGCYINTVCTASVNPQNSGYFKVANVITDDIGGVQHSIIQLEPEYSLVTESVTGGSSSFLVLNNIFVFGSQFDTTNETLFYNSAAAAISNYAVQITQCYNNGKNMSLHNSLLVLTHPQTVTVGPSDCDYSSLADACDSIIDASFYKPYEIRVSAGIYYEIRTVNVPSYVSIVGENNSGNDVTCVISFETDNGSTAYTNNAAIILGIFKTLIYGLKIRVPGSLNLVDTSNIYGVYCRNSPIVANTSTSIVNCVVDMTPESGPGSGICHEIFIEDIATSQLDNVTINMQTNLMYATVFGLQLPGGSCLARNVSINISALGSAAAYGIFVEHCAVTSVNPQITVQDANYTCGYYVQDILNPIPYPSPSITDTPNTIYGGSIVASSTAMSTTSYAVDVKYNCYVIAYNTLFMGPLVSQNTAGNTAANSYMRTLNGYYTEGDGEYGQLDTYGNQLGGTTYNTTLGDAGAIGTIGQHSVIAGDSSTARLLTNGNYNVIAGSNAGSSMTSANNVVIVGYNAGANCLSDDVVLIGANAGANIASGTGSIVIGTQTGREAVALIDTVILGTNTMANSAVAESGIIIGTDSGRAISGLDSSIIIGAHTANSLISTQNDMVIGTGSLVAIEDMMDTMIIGNNTAARLENVEQSIVIGNEAAHERTTMAKSVVIGYQAAMGQLNGVNNTGSRMIVVGNEAAKQVTTGSDSVIIGNNAAPVLTSGSRDIIIGNQNAAGAGSAPGHKLTTGSDDIIIGTASGSNLTTGNRVVIVGNESGRGLTTTNDVIILGYGSGNKLTGNRDKSIIIGNQSGLEFNGNGAVIIGHGSGTKSTGDDILIIGNQSARSVTGPRNTFVGNYTAGVSEAVLVSGSDNIIVGPNAGYQLTTGSYNVVFGSGQTGNAAGDSLTTGTGNMLIGYQAGKSIIGGSYNLCFGLRAGYNLRNSDRNIIIGNDAAPKLADDNFNNLIVGNEAGFNFTSGSNVVMIGTRAGYNSNVNLENLYIGNFAGYDNQNGSLCTYIGNFSGQFTNGSQNTAVGDRTLLYGGNSADCIGIGNNAARGANVGINRMERVIAIGTNAGLDLSTGYDDILIGTNAGKSLGAGARCIMIGPHAGSESNNTSHNIFMGMSTSNGVGIGRVTSGQYNIFVGINVGIQNTTGTNNIFMGNQAGKNNTTGANNIFMGLNSGRDVTTGTGHILIGTHVGSNDTRPGECLSTGQNSILIGYNAGSNCGPAISDVILMGTNAGMNNAVDDSIFIGTNAGRDNLTGVGCIAIGNNAGKNSGHSARNIQIGSNAGASYLGLTDAGQNIFIGDETAAGMQEGIQNIGVGANALCAAGNVNSTIAFGFEAGKVIGNRLVSAGGDANRNIIMGYQSASGGDINSDNILVGTQVAQHVDNPLGFTDNLFMGTRAGHNANLAVNSIAIGNANRQGTGGVTNIIMGTGAGDNVGNPISYYATTVSAITTGSLSVNINLPFTQAYRYFKDGDSITIQSGNANFDTVLASIQQIPSDSSNSKVVFSNKYTGVTTITSGATLNSVSVLETDVGNTDFSKASGNSLFGDNAGNQLTSGSKNTGFGTQAMYTNKIGRYNNIIGTQAGYNVISDNNTLLGTRAGYSLDISANSASLVSSDLIFASNANAIYSTTLSNLGTGYEFGTIIDISNTTDNDGRYTVEDGVNQPTDPVPSYIILEGQPVYEELGLPSTISPTAIKINSAQFNVLNQSSVGTNIRVGWFEYNSTAYNGIYNTTGPDTFINTLQTYGGAFLISGSKYNDGIHYINRVTVASGYAVTHDKLIAEAFDSNVTIQTCCIVATDITGSNDFRDFNYSNPTNMFFTVNKGVYTASPLTEKSQLSMPTNDSIYVLNKADIKSDYNQDNIVFEIGYKNQIEFAPNETSEDYQVFDKIVIDAGLIGGSILFFNNVIIISQIANYGIVANEYYDIEAYDSSESLICGSQVILVDEIEISGSFLRYVINPEYPLPANNNLSRIIFKKCQVKKLIRNVTNEFSPGDIVLFNISHEFTLKTERGAFIIRDAISPSQTDNRLLIRSDDSIPDIYYTLSETQDKLWDSNGSYSSFQLSNTASIFSNVSLANITYRILQTNNFIDAGFIQDPSKQVAGWGIFCQNANITATGSNVYSCYASNNCITASNNYEFKDIVAPCYIAIDDPTTSYYVVKENKWPFNKLVIDSASGTLNTTTINNIQIRSISSRFDTSNLANVANGFALIGLSDLTQTTESVLSNNIIQQYSAKTLFTGPETFTVNGYDTVMTIAAYDTTPNSTPGYTNGYFKNMDLSANVTVLYNNIYDSLYEPVGATLSGNTFIEGKRLIINPDITDSGKYVISNAGNVGASWSNVAVLSAPSNIFTSASPNLNIITFANPIDVYGESFSQAKISKSGYLLFESNSDVYQLSFNTSADSAFNIAGAGSNIRVWDVVVGSGVNEPGYTLVHYMVNPDAASADQSANNNVQLKIFPSSATFKPNRIELCYSNGISQVSYTEQVVIGMDRVGSVAKECRYVTDISAADNIVRTCPYEGYQSGNFDQGNHVIKLNKTNVAYETSPSNNLTSATDFYKIIGINDTWIYTGYTPSANNSNIGIYQTDVNNNWTLFEELNSPTFNVSDTSTRMAITYSDSRLILANPTRTVNSVSGAGEIYFYQYDGSTWQNLAQTINLDGTAYGATTNEAFGHVMSLSNDILVVGTAYNSGFGRAYIYTYDYSTSQFTLATQIISSSYSGLTADYFGFNVRVIGRKLAVYADDTTATVHNNQGAVYIFDISNTSSPTQLAILYSDESGSLVNKKIGSTAIEFYNENQILVGDGSYQDPIGRVVVFKTTDNWSSYSQSNIIRRTDATGRFGFSIGIYNNSLIVSSAISPGGAEANIYLFTYDGLNWTNEQKIWTGYTDFNYVAIGKYGYSFVTGTYSYVNPLSALRGRDYYTDNVTSINTYSNFGDNKLVSPNQPSFPLNAQTSIYDNYMAINSYDLALGGRVNFYKLINNQWVYQSQIVYNARSIYLYRNYLFLHPANTDEVVVTIYTRDSDDTWSLYTTYSSGGIKVYTDNPVPFVAKDNQLFIGNVFPNGVAALNQVVILNYLAISVTSCTPPVQNSLSRFGYDLAINPNYLVVSDVAPTGAGSYGSGVLYIYNHASYTVPVYTLNATSTSITSPLYFGYVVDINNSNTVLVTAPFSNSNNGAFSVISTTSSVFDTLTDINGAGTYGQDIGKSGAVLESNKFALSHGTGYWLGYNLADLTAPFVHNSNSEVTYITSDEQYMAIGFGSNVYMYTDPNVITNDEYIYVKEEYNELPYINCYEQVFSNITTQLDIGSNSLANIAPSISSTFTINNIAYDTANITIFKNGSIGFKNNEFYQYLNVFGGYTFDRVFTLANTSEDRLSIVYDTDLGSGKAYAELYFDGSIYAKNIKLGYENMPNTAAGVISLSSVPYNQYNANIDLTQKATHFSIKYTSPSADLASNINLLEPADIVNVEGHYYEVLETANSAGNYYIAVNINDGSDDNLNIGDYAIECNEFRATPTVTPQSDTINYNFRNARTLVGTNSDFLRFSQVRTLSYAPYTTNQREIHVTDETYNFATKTMDSANSVSLLSNNVVYLREPVPNEYRNLRTSNITSAPNKYIISIGTPTLDPGSNVVLQMQNINAKPTGFIDVLVNDMGTTGNSSVNWIFNSNVDALVGNITINTSANTISITDIAPDMAYGGGVPFRNDGVGLINKVTNTFDNILPGTYIRLWDSSHSDTYLITGKSDPLTLEYDPTFSPGTTEVIAFNGGTEFRIDYGFTPDPSVANGIYSRVAGQVISDRIDFNQFSNIAPYNPSNTAPVSNYLAVHKLPVFCLEGLNNQSQNFYEYFYYFNNYKIYDGSFKLLSNAASAVTSNSTLDFHYSGGVNNRTMMYDIGDHALLLPTSNIGLHVVSNIEFINFSGSYTVEFNEFGGYKYLYNSSGILPSVKPGQIIKVTGSAVNDGYYLVDDIQTTFGSGFQIYINTSYKDFTVNFGVPESITLESNVIYSLDTSDVDLSVYLPGQKLKIEATYLNNTTDGTAYQHTAKVISPDTTTVPTCVYISVPQLINESGSYCKLSKCILTDELCNIAVNTVTVNSGLDNLSISSQPNNMTLFRSGQSLLLNDTSSDLAEITVSGQPTELSLDFALVDNISLAAGIVPSMYIYKPVTFNTIGQPISTITDDGIVKFHYLDAQGNNLMLGSFTGQFAGATALSIQNVFIGNKVGQTNQGSGNILLGNETGFALTASDGATSYNNKFAVYKNNFIGVPNNPLIGGDFASGRVGINTIDPDSLLTGTLDTVTRMVVNGGVRAQAFTTFTGTHFITVAETPGVRLEPGMLMVSTGKVNKLALLDTIVECRVSSQANDKRVYGVYSNSELVNGQLVHQVAGVGEGQILVCNIGGDLECGDYISSSPISGLGQRQPDDILRSYTVAKVTESVDWDSVHEYVWFEGVSYKRCLVSCVYHCG